MVMFSVFFVLGAVGVLLGVLIIIALFFLKK